MNKHINISINYFLLILIIIGLTWFTASIYNHQSVNTNNKTETTNSVNQQNKPINPDTLISSIGAIIILFLKYFLYDKKKKPRKNLLDDSHPLFTDLDQSLFDIKSIEFGSPGRTDLFRIMLAEQYSVFTDYTKNFVYSKPMFKSAADFRTKCRQLITSIIRAYEDKWRTLGIPEIAITKVRDLNYGRIELLLNDIDTISFYRAEDNYDEALFYILTSIMFMLKFGITLDNIKLLKQLNGELSGKKFNNKDL